MDDCGIVLGFATEAQLGGLTSQMHNMSLHATNAGVSQPGADVNGGAAGGAMAAAQPAPSSHMPQMAMHPSYTYPIYHYPLHYGMQVALFVHFTGKSIVVKGPAWLRGQDLRSNKCSLMHEVIEVGLVT